MWMRRTPPMLGTTFVDEEVERTKAGMLIAAIVAFLISGWFSYKELTYALRGEAAEATVQRMYEYTETTGHGHAHQRLAILYEFTDHNGHLREDRDSVPLPTTLHGAPTVRIQYLPGAEGNSRLAANQSILGPVVFLMCLAVVVFSLFRLIREASAPFPRRR